MSLISKKDEILRKIGDHEHKIQPEDDKTEGIKAEIAEIKYKSQESEKNFSRVKDLIAAKEKEGLLTKGELITLEQDKEQRAEERKIREALEDLKKYQKGYHGFFYELVHVLQNKYETAVKVALQGSLKLLVVENTEVAEKVDEYLSEKGLYLEMLILQKVPESNNSVIRKSKKLEGMGCFAIEVVECEKSIPGLENALKYFCGDKVI